MTDQQAGGIRYVVQIDKGEDLIVDDNHLTLTLRPGRAIFNDLNGIALAIPAERIRGIQRLDEAAPLTDDEP
ncbi:hypothetical protein [Streptomyces sp. C3-3]|uniref:hypothetical protein n=1 Tax=Streptomyces sp. C3-3 TaxID=2824901 RepID=UPI001B362C80|nr:hypothetical protein [Streptomyces sp. C3-3]MBQ1118531.1 hypothetical protein [Streptomyces sp. C3-3]